MQAALACTLVILLRLCVYVVNLLSCCKLLLQAAAAALLPDPFAGTWQPPSTDTECLNLQLLDHCSQSLDLHNKIHELIMHGDMLHLQTCKLLSHSSLTCHKFAMTIHNDDNTVVQQCLLICCWINNKLALEGPRRESYWQRMEAQPS